jgi:hypothetical protein
MFAYVFLLKGKITKQGLAGSGSGWRLTKSSKEKIKRQGP